MARTHSKTRKCTELLLFSALYLTRLPTWKHQSESLITHPKFRQKRVRKITHSHLTRSLPQLIRCRFLNNDVSSRNKSPTLSSPSSLSLCDSIPISMDPPKPSNLSSLHTPRDSQTPQNPRSPPPKPRDFLTHLESYLAKRDGVDKLLKISRYATKIILASSVLPSTQPLHPRLKAFESSVGLSRKAFRLGKFVQDLNALRNHPGFDSKLELALSIVAYGGEGVYYFVEQLVWLMKSGLIDGTQLRNLQMISAWAELIGYFGSVALKLRELRRIDEEEACLRSSLEIGKLRGEGCGGFEEVEKKIEKLRVKRLMKRLSVVQDLADGLMALGDVRDGKGRFTGSLLMSLAGLLSAVISIHKNWVSC